MSKNTDEVLSSTSGGPVEDEALGVEDVEVELDEEDYDFSAMVAGVKATRARVRIRPRSDLAATLEKLAERINSGDDATAADLAEEWDETKAAYDRTFVVVLEGRSSDWLKQFRRDAKKSGINPERKGLSDDEKADQHMTLICAQIAAQIVYPTQGVTPAAVRALADANEPEHTKLFQAMRRVNEKASGENPAFLHGRSSTRPPG